VDVVNVISLSFDIGINIYILTASCKDKKDFQMIFIVMTDLQTKNSSHAYWMLKKGVTSFFKPCQEETIIIMSLTVLVS